LSVNWATCNVGAEEPTSEGLYFQWGDVRGYNKIEVENLYNGNVSGLKYRFMDDTNGMLNKYDGDGIKTLQMEDDAANFCMGGDWRMPTWDECKELVDACNKYVTEDEWRLSLLDDSSVSVSFPKCPYLSATSKYTYPMDWWMWTSQLSNSGDVRYALPFRIPQYLGVRSGLKRFCALNVRGVFSRK
jgi:hypothetical protein